MKALAKEFFNDPVKEEFFSELPHNYYEENQLHMMLVCMEKDFDRCIEGLKRQHKHLYAGILRGGF